jgi:hypothetical protein
MAPRTFGETWGQEHLQKIENKLLTASKNLDPSLSGEYDLFYNHIKIEVKASRAVEKKSGGKLEEKALIYGTDKNFDMNFQQLKPALCDVYVWIAVWRNIITYWVLSSDEVIHNKYFSSGQHRGNVGEGQLWMKQSNISEFDQYRVTEKNLLLKVIEKYNSKRK